MNFNPKTCLNEKKNKSLIKQVKALFIKSYLLQTKFKLKFLNLAHL